mmetsp:Transcript_24458/g.53170  ORF Transcript_24458/g.53170 Transcript_24458/m.53170 type:complete len:125 (+) Transcript_24458:661-1035(+)
MAAGDRAFETVGSDAGVLDWGLVLLLLLLSGEGNVEQQAGEVVVMEGGSGDGGIGGSSCCWAVAGTDADDDDDEEVGAGATVGSEGFPTPDQTAKPSRSNPQGGKYSACGEPLPNLLLSVHWLA